MTSGAARLLVFTFALVAMSVVAPHDAAAQRKFSFAYDQPHTTAYGIAARRTANRVECARG